MLLLTLVFFVHFASSDSYSVFELQAGSREDTELNSSWHLYNRQV